MFERIPINSGQSDYWFDFIYIYIISLRNGLIKHQMFMIYPPSFAYMIINQYISIRIICQRSITRSSTRAVAVWQMSCVALLLRNLVIEKVQREGLDDNVWSATSSDKVWKAMFSWVVWSQTRALYLLLQCTKAAKGNPDTYCKKHRLCAKVHFWAGRMIKGAWKLFCMLRPMTSITNSCETQFSKQKGDQSLV